LSRGPALANADVGPNGKSIVACEVCGKRLSDPSSLYRHRKIHSGEKPHQCPYCDRKFIQESIL
jgi:KRAB domain-containing zinc finger protein